MKKWIIYTVLAILAAVSFKLYSNKGLEVVSLTNQIGQIEGLDDPDDKAGAMKSKLQSLEGEHMFNGILLTFLGAGLFGVFFVCTALPFFAQRLTHAVYDSAEVVEKDALYVARSLTAQGKYAEAIEAFQQAAIADPLNRLPYLEIAKIQRNSLLDAPAAMQTIRHALESQEWEIDDAAYLLFRLAEMHDEEPGGRPEAIAVMQQVIDLFPGTRHSANASHKLHEWSVANAAGGDAQAATTPRPMRGY
jgi:tetratricopeptide (TPR) repeat protein